MTSSLGTTLALKSDVYARALDARDARFDGVFFVGITTTRIYCRPVCPARVSYRDHRRFFQSAAAAERAGFRPCLRCRPELAPGLALVDAVPRLARAAANRIAAGALNGHPVADLARDLGVSERHLRRALEREIGASPLELAQTHRLLLAKRLLADTGLAITRIAYASGFQSLRRFNAAFRAHYRMSPSAVRVSPRGRSGAREPVMDDAPLRLSLSYRAPFAWESLLAFLHQDAVDGVELVEGGRYARTVDIDGHRGVIVVENAAQSKVPATQVSVDVSPSLVPVLMPLLARLRHLFDLDAEPTVIDAHLADGGLDHSVAAIPGVRIPGAFDGFDVALRAVLRGRARGGPGDSVDDDPAARVYAALGEPIATGIAGMIRLAPTAARVAQAGCAGLTALGVPLPRANAAVALARLVGERELVLGAGSDPDETHRRLMAIDGVSDEQALVIVMRALYSPDVPLVSDPALQRAAGVGSPGALQQCAERWRPWRTYAALRLWMEDDARSARKLE